MVINTPYGNSGPRIDGYEIRSAAVAMNIPCVTTVQGASAAVQGIEAGIRGDIGVMSLQELHSALGPLAVARIRRPAGRRGVASAGRCAWASIRTPSCCAAWGLPVDADGLREVLRRLRRGVRRLRGGQAAGGVLRGVRRRGLRGAGAHHRRAARRRACWCWPTPSAATSAPRWRPTPRPGSASRRWPSTP